MGRLRSTLKAVAALVVAIVVACAAFYGWLTLAPRRVPIGQQALETLNADSMPAFRSTFNESEGRVRILAMLSPT